MPPCSGAPTGPRPSASYEDLTAEEEEEEEDLTADEEDGRR